MAGAPLPLLSCCLLLALLAPASASEVFYMDEICSLEIDMQSTGRGGGVLTLRRTPGVRNTICGLVIRAPPGHQLLLKFDSFDFPAPFGCSRDFLQVTDGVFPVGTTAGPRPIGNPITEKLCEKNTPGGEYVVPKGEAHIFYYRYLEPMRENFELVFTAFRPGPCRGGEFQCRNGRCIDEKLHCDWYDHCGDGSDRCMLSVAGIVGIVIAAIIVIVIISLVLALIVYRRRRQRIEKRLQLKSYLEVYRETGKMPPSEFDESFLSRYSSLDRKKPLYYHAQPLHVLDPAKLPDPEDYPRGPNVYDHVIAFRCYPAPVPKEDRELVSPKSSYSYDNSSFMKDDSADSIKKEKILDDVKL